MRKQWSGVSILIALGFVLLFTSIPVLSLDYDPGDLNIGPYIDTVVYKVIEPQDQRALALQAGEIEFDTSLYDLEYLPIFAADPDLDIFTATENGYDEIIINCEKYPLNISGLRRAFAYAFNKSRVVEGWMQGMGRLHDSVVPYTNGWCVEDDFEWHYYDAEPVVGNAILNSLNFNIDSGTGYRLAPDGSPFDIVFEHNFGTLEYPSLPHIVVEALDSLHINASQRFTDFNDTLARLDSHGDFDMAYYSRTFDDYDVRWIADEFWSNNTNVDYQNPYNFRNDTFDVYRDQLLYGVRYEDVYEASANMQEILHYNVPCLVVSMETFLQPYRNDQFRGHVEDLGRYISNPWTMRKIQKLDGTFGGTVPIAISDSPDSFNIYNSTSRYSEMVFSEIWPTLYSLDPNLQPYSNLAYYVLIETSSDNTLVPEGHKRFTMNLIDNAVWSDGTPLTANDVAFTFEYLMESGARGLSYPAPVQIQVPSNFVIVLEYNTESYWHFNDFAYEWIIPEHIFNNETGIGYLGWDEWDPVFDPAAPMVTCGPFIFSDYEMGEFYEITWNPLFHYAPTYHDCPPPPPYDTPVITTRFIWPPIIGIALQWGIFALIVFTIAFIPYYVGKRIGKEPS